MPSFAIVGASRGLGYAWLQHLSQDPSNTIIGLARTPSTVSARLTNDSSIQNIQNIHILPADQSSQSTLLSAATLATPLLPSGLDVLIINGAYNNPRTAFLPPSSFASAPSARILHDDMHTSLDTNVLGVVYAINAFLPLILQGKVKKIIVVSTGMADTDISIPGGERDGNSLVVTYSAMKAALNMVVAKFAAELKGRDVALLALSPGVVDTREMAPSEEEEAQWQGMIASFKKISPQWKGPLTPMESVELQRKVIDGLTMNDTGKFLSHWGDRNWL